MPTGLVRYQKCGIFHFVALSCYRRQPLLGAAGTRHVFEQALEGVRQRYTFVVAGYVAMPEHVHLLVNEPLRGSLYVALQAIKLQVARLPKPAGEQAFWQNRYYDFNV